MDHFDAIIIGAGQAGPSLAARLATAGQRTALIERHLFGGTCVNTGCIPTKTLIASARAAYQARRAGDYGVTIDGAITVDMPAVKARKDAVAGTDNDRIPQWMADMDHLTAIQGHARFRDAHTIEVDGTPIRGERIFINVGGRARVPDMPGLDTVDYLTNSSMMDVDYLPEHLVIVGGSYIGLEFGQMYRRFGSRVTIVEKGDRLIAKEDPAVSEAVREILEAEGIAIRCDAECIGVKPRDGGVAVDVECADGPPEIDGSHLLLAVGRVPNTHDLGLENAGIARDERGYITVDDRLRTSQSHVWALGDCNGRGAFTHTAYNDFQIVAANLLDAANRSVADRIPCYALYTDPPLGRIGQTVSQVRESGRPALVGHLPMSKVGRAREMGETHGFMSVVVDADSKAILGAAILGVRGDEVVQGLLDAMYAGAPFTTVRDAMHIHPTVAELIPTLLDNLEPLE